MDSDCRAKVGRKAAIFSKKDAADLHHVCVVLEVNGTFIQLTMSHLEDLSHREGPYDMSTLFEL
jgi:hypothetical protein